jgi:hypothetical protein
LIVLTLAPIALLCLALVISFNSPEPLKEIWNWSICLGAILVLLLVLGSIIVSDLREWMASRTAKLTLCDKGLIYESRGEIVTCLWNEIRDVRHKHIPSYSLAFRGSQRRVINSIIRNDGTAIVFPETLNLPNISDVISALRKSAGLTDEEAASGKRGR